MYAVEAAQLKTFGELTRTAHQWLIDGQNLQRIPVSLEAVFLVSPVSLRQALHAYRLREGGAHFGISDDMRADRDSCAHELSREIGRASCRGRGAAEGGWTECKEDARR